MYCPHCGQQNDDAAKFCLSCGKPISEYAKPAAVRTSPLAEQGLEPGRGGMILTFGIVSLLLLGPILGIPAWIMGHKDLKKIRAGIIVPTQKGLTQAGMILGIIGTFLSVFTIIMVGIAIAVGLSLFSAQSIQSNKDAMINDLNNIAAQAYQYRIRPASMAGGNGSYLGFVIPQKMANNANGSYSSRASRDYVKFYAVSANNTENTITVVIDSDGKFIMSEWSYTGDFQ